MKKQTILVVLTLIVSLLVFGGQTAMAATDCTFTTIGDKMNLDGDCTTDETIFVPDGFTLDGKGYTITAVDPDGGHFIGAVIKNAGATANVMNLTIDTDNLANVCDSGADRLRGILFEGASGKITNNTILNINQGDSGCQEGNAIEVRNEPFDGSHPNTQTVNISDNVVSNYQKGGIICNGDVFTRVIRNEVVGLGPVDFIAQNGIQFGFGASGAAQWNTVSGNQYTGSGWASGGILAYAPGDDLFLRGNEVAANDVGVWVIDAIDAAVSQNVVTDSTYDGIALDSYYSDVSGARVDRNRTNGNGVGIGLYGATTFDNSILNNLAKENVWAGFFAGYGSYDNFFWRNRAKYNEGDGFQILADTNRLQGNKAKYNDGSGIVVDGTGNDVVGNRAKHNSVLDIDNTGDNAYRRNVCDTSSGPPVDCGTTPTSSAASSALSAPAAEGRFTAQPTE